MSQVVNRPDEKVNGYKTVTTREFIFQITDAAPLK